MRKVFDDKPMTKAYLLALRKITNVGNTKAVSIRDIKIVCKRPKKDEKIPR